MLADGDTDYLEPEEKDRLLHMDDQEMLEQVFDKPCMGYLFHER